MCINSKSIRLSKLSIKKFFCCSHRSRSTSLTKRKMRRHRSDINEGMEYGACQKEKANAKLERRAFLFNKGGISSEEESDDLDVIQDNLKRGKHMLERVTRMGQGLVELGHSFSEYSKKSTALIATNDDISKLLAAFGHEEYSNTTAKLTMKGMAKLIASLSDNRTEEVKRIERRVVPVLGQYEQTCKYVKNSFKEAIAALQTEKASHKRVGKLVGKEYKAHDYRGREKGKLLEAEAEAQYEEDAEYSANLQRLATEHMLKFETTRIDDTRKCLKEFLKTELAMHAKAIEILAEAYKYVGNIDEIADLKVLKTEIGIQPIKAKSILQAAGLKADMLNYWSSSTQFKSLVSPSGNVQKDNHKIVMKKKAVRKPEVELENSKEKISKRRESETSVHVKKKEVEVDRTRSLADTLAQHDSTSKTDKKKAGSKKINKVKTKTRRTSSEKIRHQKTLNSVPLIDTDNEGDLRTEISKAARKRSTELTSDIVEDYKNANYASWPESEVSFTASDTETNLEQAAVSMGDSRSSLQKAPRSKTNNLKTEPDVISGRPTTAITAIVRPKTAAATADSFSKTKHSSTKGTPAPRPTTAMKPIKVPTPVPPAAAHESSMKSLYKRVQKL